VKKVNYMFVLTILFLICNSNTMGSQASVLPNDPYLSEQWGWFEIKADGAYASDTHGKGVIVAVLDTGVDTNHPDLKENIIEGWNFVDDNDNVTDLDGHGTHVTGIIAAVANNGVGIAGIAPEVKIMPLKIIEASGGLWGDIDSAILYAKKNGANIISMSLGGSLSPKFALPTSTIITLAHYSNITLIAAAGNENTGSQRYPAAYEHVIAVSAINNDLERAEFSNYGGHVKFSAPGVNIISTMPTYPCYITTELGVSQNYASLNGTSMACPFVTGVAALLLSKYPGLTPDMIEDTLATQAIDLGEEGWDPEFGYGVPDASKAVTETPIPEFMVMRILILTVTLTLTILNLKKVKLKPTLD
jgi:subtilisin family serine protease